jgi:hypothetical protein
MPLRWYFLVKVETIFSLTLRASVWFVQPILEEELRTRVSTQTLIKVNLDGVLHCPHDLSHIQDFRDDHPTLLGNTYNANEIKAGALNIQKRKPIITLFEVIYLTLVND